MTASLLHRAVTRDHWIGRGLRWPLDRLSVNAVLPVLSGPLFLRRWIVGAGLHRCWLGTYEREKQRALSKILSRGMVVCDIGANTGFYTLLMSRRVGREGHVHAFEPSPGNLAFLRQHMALNKVSNATVHGEALSDGVGQAFFDTSPGSYQGRLDPKGRTPVSVTTLDHLWEQGALPPVDLLKIDIEGAEAGALRGGERLLRRFRPTLFLATHGVETHRECCRLLRSFGYRVQSLDGNTRVEETDELIASNR
ncbi:MAG: FkbM family methyltransferase [Verrucomicrobia bacterium]|nr:FkbM family methyltransferase [Verrucomicrobiota bacterium]MBI3870629.1 FkbM family methyltransferase [Verrucomicrobiota bacterium]